MQWKGRTKSTNIEDRRGVSMGGIGAIGGSLGIIVMVLFLIFGGDPGQVIDQVIINPGSEAPYQETAEEAELVEFVSVILADTEYVWNDIFNKDSLVYQVPTLVLYSGFVDSACGKAGPSTGPFYCSGDSKVYIDLSFFEELQNDLNAPGDFAIAYVVAHEVGHHVQNQLGIMDQMQKLQAQLSKEEYNKFSVRLELQADYLAGVWAHYVDDMNNLDEGDIEEALGAANAVGDDRIQKQSQGYIVPDSFTHGTSAQRMNWFMKGYKTGDLSQWDTFSIDEKDL